MYRNMRSWIYFGFLMFIDVNLARYLFPIIEPGFESIIVAEQVTSYILYVLLFIFIFIGVKTGILPKINISFKSMKFATLRTGLILCCIVTILVSIITVLLVLTTDNPLIFGGNVSSDNYSFSTLEKSLFAISACIGAPILEELMYRGVFFAILKRTFSDKIAIVFSSLLFGILHLTSAIVIFNAFLMGMVFAFIYAKSNNLAYSMVLHFLMNFIVTLKSFGL